MHKAQSDSAVTPCGAPSCVPLAGGAAQVEYRDADGKDASSVLLLADLDVEAGRSAWMLANVRANAPVKGRALSKRALSQVLRLPLGDIYRVRIHVDF
jgi:hypothetical protein